MSMLCVYSLIKYLSPLIETILCIPAVHGSAPLELLDLHSHLHSSEKEGEKWRSCKAQPTVLFC